MGMGLKFQSFLKMSYFFPKFSKNSTLRETGFSILVFLRPYLGLVKVKKGILNSVTLFSQVPMGPVNEGGGVGGPWPPHFFTKNSYFENFQLFLHKLFSN